MGQMRELMESVKALYETDEHEWIGRQIDALRNGRLDTIDRENLIQYLTEMTIRDRRELESCFVVLLHHLLKLELQPDRYTRSWMLTIIEQQDAIRSILKSIPSLAQYLPRLYADAYPTAVRRASAETGIPATRFPPENPWTPEQAIRFSPPEPPEHPSHPRRRVGKRK